MRDVKVNIHPHALIRCGQRGAIEVEVETTVRAGESFPAKHGRTGYRRNFVGPWTWRGKSFDTKQIEVYAVFEDEAWLVITIITKYF